MTNTKGIHKVVTTNKTKQQDTEVVNPVSQEK